MSWPIRAETAPVEARVVGLLLAVLLAPAALAQTPTRDQPFPRIDGARQWGPFLVDLDLVIENIGYDDNVFLVAPDDPRDKESAWVVNLGPQIALQTQFGPRVALTIEDQLRGQFFFGVDNLNSLDNTFEPQLDILLGRLLFTTAGRTSTTQTRPSNEFDQRSTRKENLLEQTARLFIGARTDLAVTVGEQELRFEDPDDDQLFSVDPDGDGVISRVTIGEAFDRDRTRWTAELGWRPRGKTRFFAEYEFTEYDFVSDFVSRDSEDTRWLVGMEFRPDARVSGRIAVGRAELENTAENLENPPEPFEGTVAEAEVVYRPSRRARVLLGWEQDVRFSNFDRNFYFESQRYQVELEWFLASRWGLQAGTERRELSWPEPTTVSRPVGLLREDEIDNTYGGILYQFSSGLTLGIRAGRRERTSNLRSANDEQNYVQTTGSVRF